MKKDQLRFKLTEHEQGNIASSVEFFLQHSFSHDKKVLDIGCNRGSLIANLSDYGFQRAFGIDLDSVAVNEGQRVYPSLSSHLYHYDGGTLPFKDNTFEIICMFDVIEHIEQIETFLKNEVYRCLAPGGIFLFQTPNKYQNIIWEIINRRNLTLWRTYHCSLQTPQSLYHLLVLSGFEAISLTKYQIVTDYNLKKVRKKLGVLGPILLKLAATLPLRYSTNLWGQAHKK